ncbi:sugar kinase [Streptomyces tubbatahanensis]|uniref:Sugar kinase n=1 Tax=Streptomyces tubbatahanensis TaxID=2923272 RepID=A0ABY3XLR1_9ACTN|nr:sugar kinase [Streptomyces tubbatahanensis]UNS95343.1 sugar kinase [Streptomyces tubbatahanensis]
MTTSTHPQVLALGEPLLEFNASSEGPLTHAADFQVGYGGDTSNMAIAARRSGARAGYLTRVGDDAFGRRLLDLWQAEGVDTAGVTQEAGGRTGIYFVSRHGRGAHTFAYYRDGSPASRLSPSDVPASAVAAADLLHVSGITQAISSSACDAAFHAVATARRYGTLVSYDPNHRPALWSPDRARGIVMRTVELADLVLPSLEEGRTLTGESDPERVLDAFARRGPSLVVLKMGEAGVLVAETAHGRTTHVPAHPVRAVDATGAGDTFDGAFAARLLAGATPLEAARYAVIAAALTTTGFGAVDPIPHRGTVAENLETQHRGEDRAAESDSRSDL